MLDFVLSDKKRSVAFGAILNKRIIKILVFKLDHSKTLQQLSLKILLSAFE